MDIAQTDNKTHAPENSYLETQSQLKNETPGYYEGRLYPAQPYPITHERAAIVHRRSTALRILRALIIALIVWLLFGAFGRCFIKLGHWNLGHRHHFNPGSYPIPRDVTLGPCASSGNWTDDLAVSELSFVTTNDVIPPPRFPLSAKVSFDFPLSSDVLFLLSRGHLSAGSVNIVTSPDQSHEVATFHVIARYFREDIRDLAKVCTISRREGQNGVGIFTPGRPRKHYPIGKKQIYFETTVVLPESSVVQTFETDVQDTLHQVGDLASKVVFSSILLKGSHAPISVKSLRAEHVDIRTCDGAIRGVFNASTSLNLITNNAVIDVDVGLDNKEGEPATKAVIRTSNSPVNIHLSLLSSTGEGGSFNVTTATSYSPLHVDFPSSPVDSVLHFAGSTSNSPVKVSLNPAYEGAFFLQTSFSMPRVREDRSVEDPSGKNRTRVVQYHRGGLATLNGTVHWAGAPQNDEAKGTVALYPSNSPVELQL